LTLRKLECKYNSKLIILGQAGGSGGSLGRIASPNHPEKYASGQKLSWRIVGMQGYKASNNISYIVSLSS
jgi:hypothetical protein